MTLNRKSHLAIGWIWGLCSSQLKKKPGRIGKSTFPIDLESTSLKCQENTTLDRDTWRASDKHGMWCSFIQFTGQGFGEDTVVFKDRLLTRSRSLNDFWLFMAAVEWEGRCAILAHSGEVGGNVVYWPRRAVRGALTLTCPKTECWCLIFGGIVVGCAFIEQTTSYSQ